MSLLLKRALLSLSLLAMFAPVFVAAQTALPGECQITDARVAAIQLTEGQQCPGAGTAANIDTQGICCVFNAIYTVTNWIFFALIVVVILLVVIGGWMITTAGGDAAKVTTGRNFIVYAAIGLAVALIARAIPGAVRIIMGTPA